MYNAVMDAILGLAGQAASTATDASAGLPNGQFKKGYDPRRNKKGRGPTNHLKAMKWVAEREEADDNSPIKKFYRAILKATPSEFMRRLNRLELEAKSKGAAKEPASKKDDFLSKYADMFEG